MPAARQIVIIGNGIAGNTAALAAQKGDPSAGIQIISEEPHPAYSACVLGDYVAGQMDRDRVFLPQFSGTDSGTRRVLGRRVEGVDTAGRAVHLGGESLPYDALILATGSRPIWPRFAGEARPGLFALKTMADAEGIRHHLATGVEPSAVVVGAGPVGIEVAVALRRSGCDVTILEALPSVLGKVFDPEVRQRVQERLEQAGIRVAVGETVKAILGTEVVEGVETETGIIRCSTLVLCVGMRPNTDLARHAGIRVGELGGITVDDGMATSVPGVFACGDCVESLSMVAGRPTLSLLWHNAMQQGRVAGAASVGRNTRFRGAFNLVGLHVYDLFAVSVGETLSSYCDGSARAVDTIYDGCFRRIVTRGDAVVGGQFVGYDRGVGTVLAAIGRRGEYGPEAWTGGHLRMLGMEVRI